MLGSQVSIYFWPHNADVADPSEFLDIEQTVYNAQTFAILNY